MHFQWIGWVLTFTAFGILLTILRQAGLVPKLSLTSVEPMEDDAYTGESFNSGLLHDDRNSTSELRISRHKIGLHDTPCGSGGVHQRRVVMSPKSEQNVKRASRKLETQSRSHPLVSDLDFGRLYHPGVGKADADSSMGQKKTVQVYYVDDPVDRKHL